MKVMVRVGQLKSNKDGVPAEEEEEEGSDLVGMQGERWGFLLFFFLLNLRQETVFSWEGWGHWESGENR